MNRLLIVKTGEKDLEQILADACDTAFGREVGAVDVIDAAYRLVGIEYLSNKVLQLRVHGMKLASVSERESTVFGKTPSGGSICKQRSERWARLANEVGTVGAKFSICMLPLVIPAIASVASTAFETWGRVAEAQAAAKTQATARVQSPADFTAFLDKTKVLTANFQPALTGADLQNKLAALPEVKAMLNSDFPGAQMSLSVSPQGQITRQLPGGMKLSVVLSPESQAAVNQMVASNGGSALLVNLTAQGAAPFVRL